jgi:gliding motility-associated-like protein
MLKFLSFIFLLISFASLSQQTIKVCPGESEAVTYWVETNSLGETVWSVNGNEFYTEQLLMNWSEPGVYNISVTQTNGICEDIQYFTVQVNSCDELLYYVPNSFTPDDDNFNNTFQPVFTSGFDPFDYHMSIFNRWGEIIFESYDATKGWNGYYGQMRCQDGVYIWKIEFGRPGIDDREVIVGHVVLIK